MMHHMKENHRRRSIRADHHHGNNSNNNSNNDDDDGHNHRLGEAERVRSFMHSVDPSAPRGCGGDRPASAPSPPPRSGSGRGLPFLPAPSEMADRNETETVVPSLKPSPLFSPSVFSAASSYASSPSSSRVPSFRAIYSVNYNNGNRSGSLGIASSPLVRARLPLFDRRSETPRTLLDPKRASITPGTDKGGRCSTGSSNSNSYSNRNSNKNHNYHRGAEISRLLEGNELDPLQWERFVSAKISSSGMLPRVPTFWDGSPTRKTCGGTWSTPSAAPKAGAEVSTPAAAPCVATPSTVHNPTTSRRACRTPPSPPGLAGLGPGNHGTPSRGPPGEERERPGDGLGQILRAKDDDDEEERESPAPPVVVGKAWAPPKTLLRPQASVATSMAASVLLSFMVTTASPPESSSSSPSPGPPQRVLPWKRQHPATSAANTVLGYDADDDASACTVLFGPATKRRRKTAPRRISNFLEQNEDDPATTDGTGDPGRRIAAEPLCEIRSGNHGNARSTFKSGKRRKSRTVSIPTFEEETAIVSKAIEWPPLLAGSSAAPSSPGDYGPVGSTLASPGRSNKANTPAVSPSSAFKRIPRRYLDDPTLPILRDGMRLSAPDDKDHLNSLHCFVRKELLEVFVLDDTIQLKAEEDSEVLSADKNSIPKRTIGRPRKSRQREQRQRYQQIHRVGIRCVHCGRKPKSERGGVTMSTFFPKSLEDVYRGVCTWQRIHFKACRHMPDHFRVLYKHHKDSDKSRGKKAHWIRSALEMGFRNVDEHRSGVVWTGKRPADATNLSMVRTHGKNDPLPRLRSPVAVALDLTRPSPERYQSDAPGHSGEHHASV